ncbi:hypothetical protein D4758_24125 [Enterocloster citroniae]|nr:hypothetical protein [Enterocloster citroniae]RGC08619.1 hypothetical protein DWZ14_20465 [Enterocloster citroniae]
MRSAQPWYILEIKQRAAFNTVNFPSSCFAKSTPGLLQEAPVRAMMMSAKKTEVKIEEEPCHGSSCN